MIPMVYLMFIIPLGYVLELYSKCESLFVRMIFRKEKNKKVKRRHRNSIIRACKFSVYSVLSCNSTLYIRVKYYNLVYWRAYIRGCEWIFYMLQWENKQLVYYQEQMGGSTYGILKIGACDTTTPDVIIAAVEDIRKMHDARMREQWI